MSLKFMLRKFSQRTGGDLTNTQNRQLCVDYVNEAASDLYELTDLPGSLWEQVFQVTPDKQIALPSYVGTVRAAREFTSTIPWTQFDMRPRYHRITWPDQWRGFRDKGNVAIQQNLTSELGLSITVEAVETLNVEITVVGSTPTVARKSETLVLNATTKASVKTYLGIDALQKNRRNDYNILVYTSEGTLIATIDNDALSSKYRLLDVSTYPSNFDTCGCMEILYKLRLKPMSNDEDEFIVPDDYDNIIITKAVGLWAEDNPGREQQALLSDAKADRNLGRKVEDQSRGKVHKIEFMPHPHDSLKYYSSRGRGNFRRFGSWIP